MAKLTAGMMSQPIHHQMAERLAGMAAQIRYRLQRMHWQCSAGLALLLASSLVLLGMVLPQYHAMVNLRQEVSDLQQAPAKHGNQPTATFSQDRVSDVYAMLPPESEIPGMVEAIMQTASEQGIATDKASYQITRSSAAAFSRYQITLPVHADYLALRRFITHALNRLPNLALTEFNVQRDEANGGDTGQVEARLKLTLYMRHNIGGAHETRRAEMPAGPSVRHTAKKAAISEGANASSNTKVGQP